MGASLLKEMLGAELPDRKAIAERMREVEHDGDEVTHAIMRELNASFITPFDREDIYRLASHAGRRAWTRWRRPSTWSCSTSIGELPAEIADQVDVLERAAELTAEAMPRLRSMKDLAEYWIEINRLENQADQVYRRLLARLFGGDYDALTVLKIKEVVDELEAAADAFEHVANTVETHRGQGVLTRGLARHGDRHRDLAMGFNYTNGFHDAANAIATSVSTRALTPRVALVHGRGRATSRRLPRRQGRQDRRRGHHRRCRPAPTSLVVVFAGADRRDRAGTCSPGTSGCRRPRRTR